MIDRTITLTKGMKICHDVYKNRCFKIQKIARKYATIITSRALPGIDEPEKVLINKIYKDFSIQKDINGSIRKPQKTIIIESPSGVRSQVSIAKDRDPIKYLKANAPRHKYIKTI